MRLHINFYENSADRIGLLPERIELNGTAAFGDGGTVSLASELQDSTELRFNLPPANCSLYPDRNPQLYLQIYYHDSRDPETHFIAIRSDLERQVLSIIKNSRIEYRLTRLQRIAREHAGYAIEDISDEQHQKMNDSIRETRDSIVAFIKSDEYVSLNHTLGG